MSDSIRNLNPTLYDEMKKKSAEFKVKFDEILDRYQTGKTDWETTLYEIKYLVEDWESLDFNRGIE